MVCRCFPFSKGRFSGCMLVFVSVSMLAIGLLLLDVAFDGLSAKILPMEQMEPTWTPFERRPCLQPYAAIVGQHALRVIAD